MRMRKAIAFAALLIFGHGAAVAQGPSRLTRHAERKDAGQVTRIWAECVADLNENWSRSLLDSLPTTDGEAKVWSLHEGFNDRCLTNNDLLMYGKEVRFTSELARGEIARRLVRNAVRKDGGIPAQGSATAWLRDRLAGLPTGTGYDRGTLVGHQFALCMADEHWAPVRDLVVAREGSKEESAAFAALAPKYSGCMSAGANLTLSKPLVRLLLSEAAYHALTHQPKGLAR